ncbi:nickel pincer cofactor biosynthesis protein LarC [Enterococcus faecalis]
MKALFLEPFSGLSGDMLNGLLLDLGGDLAKLLKELKKLPVAGFSIEAKQIAKNSIYGTDFDVLLDHGQKDFGIKESLPTQHKDKPHHDHHHESARNLKDIFHLIEQSKLSDFVKHHSKNVFLDIAKAEAAVHQQPIEAIHFHEVGALDSIIDIIGFFILWEQLEVDQVYSTPITDGSGTITIAHGVMPVPVPAVMELRKESNLLIHQDFEVKTELVTPTGLAIFKEIEPLFVTPERMLIEKTGYGFGKKETGKFNALRGSLMTEAACKKEMSENYDQVLKIETNIDDQTPEQLGYVMKLLLDHGALDVFYTPIQMKKNRSAILLTLLTTNEQKEFFTELLFKHTSTIGVRFQVMERSIMERDFKILKTPYGIVHIKNNTYHGITKETIEYQDCERIAKEYHLAIAEVYQIIQTLNNKTIN